MSAIAAADVPAIPQPAKAIAFNRVAELGKTISASRLNLWLQCRLKFFFRYVIQVPKPPTASMHAGTTAHRVLQEWSLARWRGESLSLPHLKQRFYLNWVGLQKDVPIAWNGEERGQLELAWRVMEHYFRVTPIKADEPPEGVELPLKSDLGHCGLPTLVGIVDLVRSGGRIVDFKVVGRTPDAGQLVQAHEIQLTGYSILYRERTARTESGLELHHLVKTKVPKLIVSSLPSINDRQRARFFRLVESYQAGLARQDFVPSPGFHCAGCDYFEECRHWCG